VQHIIDSSDDPEATVTMLSSDRPLKRMGKPIEIARGILFFASDDAPYALGSILSIDGGYTIG
jgi:NAD(P)-dependent dehydrogenase (short-subunit alcohol dehydrogenase family)